MGFILSILISAAVILLMAKLLPSITIKNYVTALWVALVIGLLNATIGYLLRLPLNLVTLFLLTFFVRLIVTAVIIQIAAFLFKDFSVSGFTPALLLSLAMAIAGAIFNFIF